MTEIDQLSKIVGSECALVLYRYPEHWSVQGWGISVVSKPRLDAWGEYPRALEDVERGSDEPYAR